MTAQTIRRTKKSTTTAQDRQSKWLSYPEASELCTLSVKQLTQAGKLPCYVVGGKVLRLKASDVEALILPADECRGW